MELPINYDKSHWTTRKKARNQYVKEQKGKCWFCKSPLMENPSEDVMKMSINYAIFSKGMFKYPIHLHHNKKTGMTIGAVHAKCNAVLWQYRNE